MQPIVVAGDEVSVVLSPTAGVQLSGSITLEASTTPVPQGFSGFRVMPTPLGSAGFAVIDADGSTVSIVQL